MKEATSVIREALISVNTESIIELNPNAMMNEIHILLRREIKLRAVRFLKDPAANPPAAQENKYTASTIVELVSNKNILVLIK